MATMDFVAVMNAIGQAAVDADLVEEGRAYAWPTTTINPPCVIVDYPEGPQAFDLTMRRGADQATFVAFVVVGDMVPRVTGETLNTYLQPFKDAVEEFVTPAWDTARVMSWEVTSLVVKSLPYSALRFEIDVVT